MNLHKASALFPFDQQADPAPKQSLPENRTWSPTGDDTSPALRLQHQLHAAITRQGSFGVEEIPFAERAIRLASRAAGYVSLAAAVLLIGWLIV